MAASTEPPVPNPIHEQHVRWLRRAATQQRPRLITRIDQAWEVAHKAAHLLRQKYGVTRVRVFGSLLAPDQFHRQSDVDLAVEGLAVEHYWDALADVLFLDNQIVVDLVDPELCPPAIWTIVEREGVDLERQPARTS
ncbi:MAG: nucleotidyltransferase domain-containing protein [Chloroflexia bacterium]|nr:nucleotidyltransferase domain-containing protein [Chloroflexia bacterium]